MDVLSAVVAPRVHCQLLPDVVEVEDLSVYGMRITMPETVQVALVDHGHNITIGKGFAVSQFISISEHGLVEVIIVALYAPLQPMFHPHN
jgi:gamma-glutamyltranspeptidase